MVSSTIDWDHFRSYTIGDENLEAEIVALFCENAKIYLNDLTQSLNAECDGWYRAAHKLKGVSRSVGAVQLATLSEQAEPISFTDDNRSILLAEITSEVVRVEKELMRVLNG